MWKLGCSELSSEWGGEKVNVDNLLRILAVKRRETVVLERVCGAEYFSEFLLLKMGKA